MLMSLPADGSLAVLNMFQFNRKAKYQPEDPEYGTDAAEVSGKEAFQRYSAIAGKAITDLGGRTVVSAAVEQVLIGPDTAAWDMVAIMYFPTRGGFLQMMANPDFRLASRHRKAALANHRMIHLVGDNFAI